MQWWDDVIVVAVLLAGIYVFWALSRYLGRALSQGDSPGRGQHVRATTPARCTSGTGTPGGTAGSGRTARARSRAAP